MNEKTKSFTIFLVSLTMLYVVFGVSLLVSIAGAAGATLGFRSTFFKKKEEKEGARTRKIKKITFIVLVSVVTVFLLLTIIAMLRVA